MWNLTVKLRGRPEAPDQAPRAHTVFSARGADTEAVHGPLQRLLDRCTLLAWHKLNFLRSIIDDHHKLVAYCRDLSFVNEYPSVPLIIYLAVPKPGSLKVRECYSMPPSLR